MKSDDKVVVLKLKKITLISLVFMLV
jgi:hypothetical protein